MQMERISDHDFIAALQKDPEAVMMKLPAGVTQEYHIQFSDSDTGFPLKADLYYRSKKPAQARPAIIFMHDWASGRNPALCGDRQGSFFALTYDFVFVPLYYRQPQFAPYPGALKDLKTCARWLRSIAPDYAIAPDQIAVMGSSAGTQWSFLAAATNGKKELDRSGGFRDFSSTINLVLLNSAICDFVKDFANRDIGQKIIGAPYAEAKAKYHEANPLENVHAGMPPVFMAHGDQDESCPIASARALADKLEKCGVTVKLLVQPGRGHGSDGFPEDLHFRLTEMGKFICAHFHLTGK